MERSANTKPAQQKMRRRRTMPPLFIKRASIGSSSVESSHKNLNSYLRYSCWGSSTKRVAGGKAVHTRKRKSSEGNDDEQAPKTKKVAKKQYQYKAAQYHQTWTRAINFLIVRI
eukprot:scaffold43101_cov167-Skeletonema_dohrnii-CCMP3373.AAC.1